jgi:hypothetical protein
LRGTHPSETRRPSWRRAEERLGSSHPRRVFPNAAAFFGPQPHQPATHDVGLRISRNNRPQLSVRPELADAKLGLPGKDVPWQKRRASMVNVCVNCGT